ncbi:MAG: FAD-binding oxidoreductase [Candidatus Dormibacteraeota bacterium]|nr:FAD-binding oxidoreductase [Candidatus Dormibacteraeota bacterium]MBV9525125.1 FAD-binding oxidoreductase [Candidatus Dormibacteraeota bacterium]
MTEAAVPPLRWYGWGDRAVTPPAGLLRLLHEELGASAGVVSPPVARDQVVLPPSGLSDRLRRRLVAALGSAHVRRGDDERLRHAAGRSYLDLLMLRAGQLTEAPDAVLHPGTPEEVLRVLRVCSDDGCAVVPFGGGTSVVGGVAPLHGGRHALVTLALDRCAGNAGVDAVSQMATLTAGTSGPAAESMLWPLGFTLGHWPQSFEYATVGGFAATRSAGQASSGYGRFDDVVRGARLVAPAGELALRAAPPDATGPGLLQMVLGSEGTLGVITEVTVRVRKRPRTRHYAGWSFAGLEAGAAALRELAQHAALPDVTRLSDAEETRVSFAMAGEGTATRAAHAYLRARGQSAPCLGILGWEGSGADIGRRMREVAPLLRRHGAIALGGAPGRAWLRSRFEGPYLRDALLDRGLLVETLETAATWTELLTVREAVNAALRASLGARGTAPLIGCHVSHVYPEGASLYFTVLARRDSADPAGQWLDAKRAATDALLAAGGALSHHHGVGRDHAPWLGRFAGDLGVTALHGLRASLDPAGIMNPGKLTARH